MAEFFYQLKLLLWKNFLLRKRSKLRMLIEIFWPLTLFLILVWIRLRDLKEDREECHLIPKALPSAGVYEFLQNTFCSRRNECFNYYIEYEDHWKNAGIYGVYNQAKVFLEYLINNPLPTMPPMPRQLSVMWKDLLVLSTDGTTSGKDKVEPLEANFRTLLIGLLRVVQSNWKHLPISRQNTPPPKVRPNNMEQLQSLMCGLDNNATQSIYDSISMVPTDGSNVFEFEPDPTASTKCNDLFKTYYDTKSSSFVWELLKPYVRGSLFYAPKTALTDEIMRRIEDKLKRYQIVESHVDSLIKSVERVQVWAEVSEPEIKNVQVFLSDPQKVELLLTLWGINDPEQRAILRVTIKIFTEVDMLETLKTSHDTLTQLQSFLQCVKYDKGKGFSTEEAAVAAALPLNSKRLILAVITFKVNASVTTVPEYFRYKIRMDDSKVDWTFKIREQEQKDLENRRQPMSHNKYFTHGFIYLQDLLERSVLELQTGKSFEEITVYMQQFPFPCITFDPFTKSVAPTFPLFMVISWVYAASMVVKAVVYEREEHLKEMMKIMGLGNMVIWTGWLLDSFVVLASSATLLSIILKYGGIMARADFTLIWVFLVSYAVSVICFCFLMSSFFSKANSAAAAGGIVFFLTYVPYISLNIWYNANKLDWIHILCTCVIANICLGFGCHYIVDLEKEEVGATWASVGTFDKYFDIKYCIIMLWVDSAIYFLLTLYVEAISPGTAGIPKKWYFLFERSTYWSRNQGTETAVEGQEMPDEFRDEQRFEAAPDELIPGVKIRGLWKTYSNGRVALKNLNVDFYENQITSFLGHNGAGKSTTMSILVGLFPPSSGTAFINGMDIAQHMKTVRKAIGICPQHNVLFDRLTVSEHIRFFSGLKGKEREATKEDVDRILNDLGFPEKRNEFPKKLSGGMKRKLCVAIAFTGGSRTVFLDEPTSGVDPFSRRSIWELLTKYKQGRTIVLTTHFMDEADILGDRVAIMSRGALKTCGSSLFLRKQFGQGYHLRLVRQRKRFSLSDAAEYRRSLVPQVSSQSPSALQQHPLSNDEIPASFLNTVTTDVLVEFIQSRIPSARLESHIGSEVAFVLPYDTSPAFSSLFNDLDAELAPLGLLSYGISDTNLEDIFLTVIIEDLKHSDSFVRNGCCSCLFCCRKKGKVDLEQQQPLAQTSDDNAAEAEQLDVNATQQISPSQSAPDTGPISSSTESVARHVPANEDPAAPLQDLAQSDSAQVDVTSEVTLAVKPSVYTSILAPKKAPKRRKYFVLWIAQIAAIFRKRLQSSMRSLKAIFLEIVLPALFIAITLAFTSLLPTIGDQEPMIVTPYLYRKPIVIFYTEPTAGSFPPSSPTTTTASPRDLGSPEVTNTTMDSLARLNDFPLGPQFYSKIKNELTGRETLSTECVKFELPNSICKPDKFSQAAVDGFYQEAKGFTPDQAKLGHCYCRGRQICQKLEKAQPPVLESHAQSRIIDSSSYLLPEWLVKTRWLKKYLQRNGGYEFQVRARNSINNLPYLVELMDFVTRQIFANGTGGGAKPQPPKGGDTNGIIVWFNNKAWHSSVAYLNSLHNMLLRDLVPKRTRSGISLVQHPLSITKEQRTKLMLESPIGILLAISMIFVLSFVPASFILYLIDERSSGGKHLHLVSGVKPIVYWAANFIYDMTKYLIPVVCAVFLFYIYGAEEFVSEQSIAAFIMLIILYGWAITPLMYPASYIFTVPSTALVVLSCTNLFIGSFTTVCVFVLNQFKGVDSELYDMGLTLQDYYMIFPQYCLGQGLLHLKILNVFSVIYKMHSMKAPDPSRFEWKHLGKFHFTLFVLGIIFFIIVILIDYRRWLYVKIFRPKPRYADEPKDEDEDVREERKRVLEGNLDSDTVLTAQNLTKFYLTKSTSAVRGLCFALRDSECFGLLGINGAGKSTTFKMLTGDERISGGTAKIAGYDVILDRDQARKHIGYCPQEDGLDPLLNSYEVLELYGKLRGMNSKQVKLATEQLIDSMGLKRYASRHCGTYSGGNKRKLSAAVALIGDPEVVFLDEPTSGMDPAARRKLWKIILHLLQIHKSIVLTSHSMEECEALCTSLGIMVNGQFMCLGSIQHLKNRFGSGYMLTVRCLEEKQSELSEFIAKNLPQAVLDNAHCSQFKFKIPQDEAKLSDIFHAVSSAKEAGLIEDYSVSQTTLDDIFVQFAAFQKDELR